MKKALRPLTVQSAFQILNQQVDSIKSARFLGTDNPRHLRVIHAIMQRPRRREDVDSIAGCSNGPDLIAALRALGLDKEKHLPVERIKFLDRDGNLCRPGIYSFTEAGKRLIWAWQARMRKGSAALHPTAEQICKLHGISRRMWFNALKVRRNGCDELNAAVKDGSVSMNLAVNLLAFEHSGQRLILAELPSIKPRERAAFVELVRAIRLKEIANG